MHQSKQSSKALFQPIPPPAMAGKYDWLETVGKFNLGDDPEAVNAAMGRSKFCKLMTSMYQQALMVDGLDADGFCRLPMAVIEATFGRSISTDELRVVFVAMEQKLAARRASVKGDANHLPLAFVSAWHVSDGVLSYQLNPVVARDIGDVSARSFNVFSIHKALFGAQLATQDRGVLASRSAGYEGSAGSNAAQAAG